MDAKELDEGVLELLAKRSELRAERHVLNAQIKRFEADMMRVGIASMPTNLCW